MFSISDNLSLNCDKFGVVHIAIDNGHSFYSININNDAEEKTIESETAKINKNKAEPVVKI